MVDEVEIVRTKSPSCARGLLFRNGQSNEPVDERGSEMAVRDKRDELIGVERGW